VGPNHQVSIVLAEDQIDHGPVKPPVHLWIYNHPFNGISDQIDFFVMALTQNGYRVSVGRQPSDSALNVVIENFTEETKQTLMAFCKATRKRIFIIMTEHIDFDGREILVHGDPLWSDNDYMHPATQLDRLKNLMECLPYLRGFLVLGDLPELRNISSMLPGMAVRSIPFPRLDWMGIDAAESYELIQNDLLFTGVLTDFRVDICAMLKKMNFSIASPKTFVSRRRRDLMNRATKVVLNIPQREGWRWLSAMRVVAALRSGRGTVSLGTTDSSRIATCCPQINIQDGEWPEILRDHLEDWSGLYGAAYESYTAMAQAFERDQGFPHDAFKYWAISEQVVWNEGKKCN
jgi:hypothetical protein